MGSLTFEPHISPVLWVSLAVLAAALLGWYAFHRPPAVPRRRWMTVVALMALGSAAVLFILLNPTWLVPVPPPAGKPLLTILVDTSASMATADGQSGRTRFSGAVEIAQSVPAELESRFDVRLRSFSRSAEPTEPAELAGAEPEGELTDLTAALTGAITEDRPQGQALLVLSDGIHNAPGGVAPLLRELTTLRAMNVPVYAVTFGSDTRLKDLELIVRRPQELAFAGQNVPIDVHVRQRGAMADRAEVVLLQDGAEVDRRKVALPARGMKEVRLAVNRHRSGLYRFEARVDPVKGEATAANNSATVLLRVIDEPVRVLLLEGKPYWDAKFLVQTIASDPFVELDSLVRLSESRFIKRSLRLNREPPAERITPAPAATANAAPEGEQQESHSEQVRREESITVVQNPAEFFGDPDLLSEYQVLVLGRSSEVFLDEAMLDRLRDWISRDGGSLVCYRGSPVARVNQRLARLLPVRWSPSRESRFRIELTERGRSLNWLGAVSGTAEPALSSLPSLASLSKPEPPKPMAVVLAQSQGDAGPPVVTYQPYGTGRVVAIEGAGMWRWAFLPPQYQQHDDVYASLWQSLLRWLVSGLRLAPGQNLALRTDKVSYVTGNSVTAVLLMREEVEPGEIPAIELEQVGAEQAETHRFTPVPLGEQPGLYRVPFGRLPEGRYRAVVTGEGESEAATTAAFDVRPPAAERLDVAARRDLMARIAAETEGAVLEPANAVAIAEEFREHMARSRPERVRRLSAWDRLWVLLAVFAVWATAWGLRRSGGLV